MERELYTSILLANFRLVNQLTFTHTYYSEVPAKTKGGHSKSFITVDRD
jgi:hypothetical protein